MNKPLLMDRLVQCRARAEIFWRDNEPIPQEITEEILEILTAVFGKLSSKPCKDWLEYWNNENNR